MEKYQKGSNENLQELLLQQTEERENEYPAFVNEECGDTMWDAVLEQHS